MMAHNIINLNLCQDLVKKHFGCERLEVVDFDVVPFVGEKLGYLADHYTLLMKIKNGKGIQQKSFFVKVFPKNNHEVMVDYMKQSNAFGKEIFFYSSFLAQAGKIIEGFNGDFAPRIYHYEEDQVIILENLTESGYKMCDSEILDVDHLKITLQTVAEIHAVSLAYEESKCLELSKKYQLQDEFRHELKDAINRKDINFTGYDYLVAAQRGLYSLIDLLVLEGKDLRIKRDEFKTKLSQTFEEIFTRLKPSKEFRNVLCHGDLWEKNIMFNYVDGKPQKCKIVDYQLIRYNPPAHDVVFFLLNSTDEITRQKHWGELLNYYHESLRKSLKKYHLNVDDFFNLDDFCASCKLMLAPLKLKLAYQVLLRKANYEYMKDVYENGDLFKKYLFLDRTKMLIDLYQTDKTYRSIVTNILDDLAVMLKNELISKEDCYVIARKSLNTTEYQFKDYILFNFDDKCGFLGDYFTLTIKTDLRDINCFVKTLPMVNSQRNFVVESGAFFKEVRFYEKMLGHLKDNNIFLDSFLPPCYLARINDIIVFEDLRKRNYVRLEHRSSLDRHKMKMALKGLSRIHAAFLILEEKTTVSTNKLYRLTDEYKKEFEETFLARNEQCLNAFKANKKGFIALVDLFEDEIVKKSKEKLKKFLQEKSDSLFDFVIPSEKFRNTLCHSDLWISNLLFLIENGVATDCKIIDFQSYRYCPPAQDVLTFIYLSSDRDFRQKYLGEMLEYYYTEMSNFFDEHEVDIGKILPYDDFKESLDYYQQFVLINCLAHVQTTMVTTDALKGLFSDPQYSKKMMFEDKSEYIFDMQRRDPMYRRRVFEAFLDLKEYFEKNNL